MLTDEQLEYISDTLRPLFQYLESEVIRDVAKRIKETMAYTRTAELEAGAMRRLGYSPSRIRKEAMKLLKADADFRKNVAKNTLEHKKEVRNLLREIEKKAYKANDKLFSDVGDLSQMSDLRLWRSHGEQLTDDSYLNDLIGAFRKQTHDELRNLTRTTGFKTVSGFESLQGAYRNELDKALIKICSGTFSREKATYDAVHNMAQSGLRTIDYGTGRHMQLDTAVKLALRTGAHQLAGQMAKENIMRSGHNLVYVTQHWGARDKGTGHANHEQWQGRVYYVKDGTDYTDEARRIGQDYITDLWRATGFSVDGSHKDDPLGLYGYNCRHRIQPFWEGVDRLEDYNKEGPEPGPFTIDGKEYSYYDITQKQRAMERSIRALKREREAMAALGMDTKEIRAKIKKKTREYEDFCDGYKKYGIKAKLNNLRYENGTSDITKTKAYKDYKDMLAAEAAAEKEPDTAAGKSGLQETTDNDTMVSEGDAVNLEYQRYGRNKETVINSSYIDSGEYRNKFNHITDNDNVNRVIYSKAKEMLKHRSGTMIEDMYWIDKNTGNVAASIINQTDDITERVDYPNSVIKVIESSNDLIAMHTHPQSMPPSAADFNAAYSNGYSDALVICHDGTVFQYTSNETLDAELYDAYIKKHVKNGLSEYDAQIKALEQLKENYDIDFWEVKP